MDTGGGFDEARSPAPSGRAPVTTSGSRADGAAGSSGLAARRLRPRSGDVHRAVGLLLLALWLTWLVTTVVVQPRFVSQDRFDADLRAGQVASWRVVAVDDQNDEPAWADRVWVNIPSADPLGNPDTTGDVPGVVSLAYFTHSPVARMRIVDQGSPPEVLTQQLRDAGIPPAWEVDPRLVDEPSRSSAELPALVLVVLFLAALVIGPRPTRGTRWFWFWMVFPTLGVGVAAYAVLEHLWRRPDDPARPPGRAFDVLDGDRWPDGTPAPEDEAGERPAVRRRRSGLAGLGTSIVVSFLLTSVLQALGSTGWLWAVRP